MAKFNLSAVVTISVSTTVEADTLEEAIEIAGRRTIEVAQNSDMETQMESVWISEEFDGEVQRIHQYEE